MKKHACITLLFASFFSLTPIGAIEIVSKAEVSEQKTTSTENEVALPDESAVSKENSLEQSTAQGDNQEITQVKEFAIVLDSDKGAVIEEIISTMGKSSVIALGFKKGHLKSLGKKIDGIGPLLFLGYIFSKAELKFHMRNIRKSSLKWNGFMDGLKPSLDREAASEEWQMKLSGFAQALSVEVEPLKAKSENRDWNGFVGYLVEN